MGCGQSVPAAAAQQPAAAAPAAPVKTLARPASSPVIKIDANEESAVSTSASVPQLAVPDLKADKEAMASARIVPVSDQVSKAAAAGVPAVLELMKAHAGDAEFQWWCCDALASLSAGNQDNRAQIFVQGGLMQVLAAMRLFTWDENVQTKSCWLLANLAADFAEHCGKQGAVEAVVAGMRSCHDSYQVLTTGVRALQNLAAASDVNRARARASGVIGLLDEILEANPEDGQLQYRGQALRDRLADFDEAKQEKMEAQGVTEVARQSPWSKLKQAILAGQAKVLSTGNVPGLHGISAQVAEAAAKGVGAVLAFMKGHPGYHDAQTWCCDALATLMTGNEPARMEVFTSGGLDLIMTAMKSGLYDEELQLKCMWALLALAPSFASEIGDADAIKTVVTSMYANRTAHQIQVAGVKLISLLTIEPHKKNVDRANEANAVRIIKAVIAAHTEDGTLQYRGVNLLERLQPGCTLAMPKQAMIRSYSMRAEEMVSQYKMSARSFAATDSSPAISPRSGAGAEAGVDTGRSSLREEMNRQAIAEVDELAVAVEEQEHDEAEGAGGHHDHTAHPGSVPSSRPEGGALAAGGEGSSESKSESKE